MGKVAVNLEEDETLADAVRKYKVLYDKSMPEYKEKLTKSNAWRKVDKSLGLEEGKAMGCVCVVWEGEGVGGDLDVFDA